ncbi:MAG: c-type cytochrome [Planctomycetales bacterium]|nr:c-type cytochrome [Planctomycetales bacterium]
MTWRSLCPWAAAFAWSASLAALAAPPRVLVDGCQLEQIAGEPELVTPIGCAFDPQGRLLVVESHTHQRPEDYDGPAGDRIRMLSDSDGDGELDHWSTFAEGFQQAMNVAVAENGDVYVVTRRDVHLLRDADNDGVADSNDVIVRLETEAEYPHNGLAGIAIDGDGFYLGLGENFGFPYELTCVGGSRHKGDGGVGRIYRCGRQGEGIYKIASGFWNPFSICLTPEGRLFTVDNDPDASPPCRLLHVMWCGDYGHRWEYGRAGVHPLQAWDGELPGTLPMVCGTGEAPTAVVAHRGWLWVTSWGDHRIERYRLAPRGSSFGAEREVVVQGDAEFRPTGMAVAPDGSLCFADWVDRSYPVHGKGRLWRLILPAGANCDPPRKADNEPLLTIQQIVDRDAPANPKNLTLAESPDPFLRTEAVTYFARHVVRLDRPFELPQNWVDFSSHYKLTALQAARTFGSIDEVAVDADSPLLEAALHDADADVRLYAVRWIADERLTELRDNVAALLDGPIPNERYFLAVLGAIDWLDGDGTPRHSGIGDGLLARELRNKRRSPELHALALRLIAPDHKWLTLDRLREYLASPSAVLQAEAVRTLALQSNPERFDLLTEIAADADRAADLRAVAVTGLAGDAAGRTELLSQLAGDDVAVVANEARRVRRLAGLDPAPGEEKPAADDLAAWETLLAEGCDAASGRRLFFTPAGPHCAACHQHSGRGGRMGPDLTRIGAQQARERIIASILQPSREIAPRYEPWVLVTDDGLAHLGLRLPQGGDDGQESYADASGKTFTLASETIDERSPSDQSIMPAGLEQLMTIDDLRDLVAFLMSPAAPEAANHASPSPRPAGD